MISFNWLAITNKMFHVDCMRGGSYSHNASVSLLRTDKADLSFELKSPHALWIRCHLVSHSLCPSLYLALSLRGQCQMWLWSESLSLHVIPLWRVSSITTRLTNPPPLPPHPLSSPFGISSISLLFIYHSAPFSAFKAVLNPQVSPTCTLWPSPECRTRHDPCRLCWSTPGPTLISVTFSFSQYGDEY